MVNATSPRGPIGLAWSTWVVILVVLLALIAAGLLFRV